MIRALPPTEYYADERAALEALQQKSQFNVIDLATGWKIDFICRRSRPFSRIEFERRIRAQLEGLPLFVATAEDVILAKLEWAKLGGSARQIEDVTGLLAVRGVDLDLGYLERWVTELDLSAQWAAASRAAGRDEPRGQERRGE